jgi:hypothetical protein
VCKVFERKEFSLDFVLVYGAKVESPACAGLGFLPDLIVAAVSRVGGWAGAEAPFEGWLFRGVEAPRLILKNRDDNQQGEAAEEWHPGVCLGWKGGLGLRETPR